MNACGLNMFHHAHYMKIFSIKNGIDLRFLAAIQEMIDQAKSKGTGVVDYVWRNPITNAVVRMPFSPAMTARIRARSPCGTMSP